MQGRAVCGANRGSSARGNGCQSGEKARAWMRQTEAEDTCALGLLKNLLTQHHNRICSDHQTWRSPFGCKSCVHLECLLTSSFLNILDTSELTLVQIFWESGGHHSRLQTENLIEDLDAPRRRGCKNDVRCAHRGNIRDHRVVEAERERTNVGRGAGYKIKRYCEQV